MASIRNAIDFLINRLIRDLSRDTRITISIFLFLTATIFFYFFIDSLKVGKGGKDEKIFVKISLLIVSLLFAALSTVYIFVI
ncbi:MAG: hypothetical protein WCX32_04405 [Clostridia bacterium]|jgi:hypothetical protein|nr:hypothetical protein [Clostridia bacterium]MDD4275997.1 hypothetical protein [Clostridia bacterium]